MSFSFSFKVKTKREAFGAVARELAKVVIAQPFHELDAAKAQEAACDYIGMLRDDPTKEICVSISGSGYGNNGADGVDNVSVSVNASLTVPIPQ